MLTPMLSRIGLAVLAHEVPWWRASSPLVGYFHQRAGWRSRSRGCGPAVPAKRLYRSLNPRALVAYRGNAGP
eukprot:4431417-Lingulodinium_polyedra.AAC.1